MVSLLFCVEFVLYKLLLFYLCICADVSLCTWIISPFFSFKVFAEQMPYQYQLNRWMGKGRLSFWKHNSKYTGWSLSLNTKCLSPWLLWCHYNSCRTIFCTINWVYFSKFHCWLKIQCFTYSRKSNWNGVQHDFHIKWSLCSLRITWRISLEEQELLILPQHPSSPQFLLGFMLLNLSFSLQWFVDHWRFQERVDAL
jgi:hypothetical protein